MDEGQPTFLAHALEWNSLSRAMDDIVIYHSKGLIAAVALFGVAIGVCARMFLMHSGQLEASAVEIVAYFAALALGAACIVLALYWMVKREPALVVNREGILCNVLFTRVGLIQWTEIAEIKAVPQTMFIVLKDSAHFLNRQPPQQVARVKKLLRGSKQILIYTSLLPITGDKLAKDIQAYRQQLANAQPDRI
jgi:hypothetical protein